jgi:hypothetical protein
MGQFGFGGGVEISRHAKKRWRERVDDPPAGALELTESVWHNAETVYAPEADCDESRVYPVPGQRDMLLCGKHKGNIVVSTVLYADPDRLEGGGF